MGKTSRDADNGKKPASVGRPKKKGRGHNGNTRGSDNNLDDDDSSGEVEKSTTTTKQKNVSVTVVQSRNTMADHDNGKTPATASAKVQPPKTQSMARQKHVSVSIVESRDTRIDGNGATTSDDVIVPAAESTRRSNTAWMQPTTRSLNPVESYLQMRLDQAGTTMLENEKRAVQRFVREHLFSKVKFITSDVELDYCGMSHCAFAPLNIQCHPYSINYFAGDKCLAHYVCTRLNIAPAKWVFFKDVVKDCIRVRRANSNIGIKREYLGKHERMHVMSTRTMNFLIPVLPKLLCRRRQIQRMTMTLSLCLACGAC